MIANPLSHLLVSGWFFFRGPEWLFLARVTLTLARKLTVSAQTDSVVGIFWLSEKCVQAKRTEIAKTGPRILRLSKSV